MKAIVNWLPFVLLLVGTIGLLLNEFVVKLGRPVVIICAAFNLVGLFMLFIYPRVIH
jgi:hypothetical protein